MTLPYFSTSLYIWTDSERTSSKSAARYRYTAKYCPVNSTRHSFSVSQAIRHVVTGHLPDICPHPWHILPQKTTVVDICHPWLGLGLVFGVMARVIKVKWRLAFSVISLGLGLGSGDRVGEEQMSGRQMSGVRCAKFISVAAVNYRSLSAHLLTPVVVTTCRRSRANGLPRRQFVELLWRGSGPLQEAGTTP